MNGKTCKIWQGQSVSGRQRSIEARPAQNREVKTSWARWVLPWCLALTLSGCATYPDYGYYPYGYYSPYDYSYPYYYYPYYSYPGGYYYYDHGDRERDHPGLGRREGHFKRREGGEHFGGRGERGGGGGGGPREHR